EPATEDDARSTSCRDIPAQREAGKFGRERRAAFGARPFLEADQPRFGDGIEIAGGNARIIVPLAGEKAGEVAHIFPLQRQIVIFGMTLEEDETAFQLPREDIDADRIRARQNLIAVL